MHRLILLSSFACACLGRSTIEINHDPTPVELPIDCSALPPTTEGIRVADVAGLRAAVEGAAPGSTILVADGTYLLGASGGLSLEVPGLTLRSVSGNPDAVILDGEGSAGPVLHIAASGVTVAEITIVDSTGDGIFVRGRGDGETLRNTYVYRVTVIDAADRAITIRPAEDGSPADIGVIACCAIQLTAARRTPDCSAGGIYGIAARDWVVRSNTVDGFWCASSTRAIYFGNGSRGTEITENFVRDAGIGIQLGSSETPPPTSRTYSDSTCASTYIDHIDGIVRNNMVLATNAMEQDAGIALWSVCGTLVVHNTVVEAAVPFSSIEYRWLGSGVEVKNNLAAHNLRQREGAAPFAAGNIENVDPSVFVDAGSNVHLAAPPTVAHDAGVALLPGECDRDFDGDARNTSAPDVGADELN